MSKHADISDEARAEYQEAFNMFDKDMNGSIEAKEFGDVMRALGHNPTDDELAEMVAGIDADGNGEIDFDEFLAMMLKQIENGDGGDADAEMMAAFKMFDIDGGGTISKSELKQTMKYLGDDLTDEQIEDMISQADGNADGEVDFEEFKKMMDGM